MDIDFEAILRTYVAESEEHLVRMEESLIGLETYPDDQKFLEAIFRGAHTIKGNAAGLGFPKVSEFAHAFEELLQRLRNHVLPVTKETITVLLRSVDALRQMIPSAIAGAKELKPEQQALLAQLINRNAPPPERQPLPPQNTNPSRQPARRRHEDFQALVERADTVRVDIQKLDRMLNLAGEIAVAHGRLRQTLETPAHQTAEALEAHGQLERLSLDLQEQIMKARMVPVGPIFRQYIRTVRDIAQASGKVARLLIHGDDVEIDLGMVEKLKDPLTHMIRNALDHGIEPPEVRRAKGKDPCGSITLKALHDGASIIIELIDDGAGLNRDRIAARVRSMGVLTEPEQLPDKELFNFIFEPGFSTAEKITDLSGRGVGMDVVRRNIETLRGTVGVDSCPEMGTTITIRLPLTLAIIEGFGVGIGDETYVLPLHAVLECIELPAEERCNNSSQGVINLRGQPLPYIRLRDWFGLTSPRPTRENVVVIEVGRVKAGLAVDMLYGARQTVIKPLGKRFQELPAIAGSAILGNGRVALILDVPGLMREVVRAHGDLGTLENNPQKSFTTGSEGSAPMQYH
jgi:two-component system, chemotaxis family, sensor kinase CheA